MKKAIDQDPVEAAPPRAMGRPVQLVVLKMFPRLRLNAIDWRASTTYTVTAQGHITRKKLPLIVQESNGDSEWGSGSGQSLLRGIVAIPFWEHTSEKTKSRGMLVRPSGVPVMVVSIWCLLSLVEYRWP
ncbi:hypothetical protein EI94DRAFT_1696924 [Lactarius quietus]|nr:hypothetical protein EI94DRAFT_1696924 [Lactarius quietus]